MSSDDFSMLSKYIQTKAKGSSVRFEQYRDNMLLVHINNDDGDRSTITFFSEDVSKFPEITRTRRLGEEL